MPGIPAYPPPQIIMQNPTNPGGALNPTGRGVGKMDDRDIRKPSEPKKKAKPKGTQGSMAKGGQVKKTGNYRLHKGEVVVPAKKAAQSRDLMRRLKNAKI